MLDVAGARREFQIALDRLAGENHAQQRQAEEQRDDKRDFGNLPHHLVLRPSTRARSVRALATAWPSASLLK